MMDEVQRDHTQFLPEKDFSPEPIDCIALQLGREEGPWRLFSRIPTLSKPENPGPRSSRNCPVPLRALVEPELSCYLAPRPSEH